MPVKPKENDVRTRGSPVVNVLPIVNLLWRGIFCTAGSCGFPSLRTPLILHVFTGVFMKGSLQAEPTRMFWRVCCFWHSRFADKLGSHAGRIANSTEPAVKPKNCLV